MAHWAGATSVLEPTGRTPVVTWALHTTCAGEGGYSNYCQGVVQRVCQHDWPPQRIAKVLLALRDFPL